MYIEINGDEVPAYPSQFIVTLLDIDDGDSTYRMSDGTLYRNRLVTKRQIDMTWGAMTQEQMSNLLFSLSYSKFFFVTYPDPMYGEDYSGEFYCGNRPVTYVVNGPDGPVWSLKVTLTER